MNAAAEVPAVRSKAELGRRDGFCLFFFFFPFLSFFFFLGFFFFSPSPPLFLLHFPTVCPATCRKPQSGVSRGEEPSSRRRGPCRAGGRQHVAGVPGWVRGAARSRACGGRAGEVPTGRGDGWRWERS